MQCDNTIKNTHKTLLSSAYVLWAEFYDFVLEEDESWEKIKIIKRQTLKTRLENFENV